MKTYMENLHDTMLKCNRYSYEYGDDKAWDNRKMKTYKRVCAPWQIIYAHDQCRTFGSVC